MAPSTHSPPQHATSHRRTQRKRAEQLIEALASGAHPGSLELRASALEAHAFALRANDRLLEAESLLQLGRAQLPLVEPADALESLRHAAEIFDANGLAERAARCRLATARALCDMAEERNAIATCHAVLREPVLCGADRVSAHVLLAICHGHLGEFDIALRVLREAAMPLADSPQQQADVKRGLALMYLEVMICKRWPDLWRGPAGMPEVAEPAPTPEFVIARLDEARAARPAADGCAYIEIARCLALGLSRAPCNAEEALGTMAAERAATDPVVAGWALYCQGLLLRQQGHAARARAVLLKAQSLATQQRQTLLFRDVLLQQARALESLGDAVASLALYKQFASLRVRSMVQSLGAPWTGDAAASHAPAVPVDHRLLNTEPAHVKRAVRFIEANLLGDLAVSDVVAHCEVGRRTLEIAFKESHAITVAQFIKQRKLDHAAQALRQTDHPVREIALSVGYRSPSAFSREFALRFGQTPSVFQRTRAKGDADTA